MAEVSWDLAIYAGPLLVLGLCVGFCLGRRSGSGLLQRVSELEADVEGLHRERERVKSELGAAKGELERASGAQLEYRTQVLDYFSGASDRMRDLTIQHRAIYDHLAEGARSLCPEGFENPSALFGWSEGPRAPALAQPPASSNPERAAAAPAPGDPAPDAPAPPGETHRGDA